MEFQLSFWLMDFNGAKMNSVCPVLLQAQLNGKEEQSSSSQSRRLEGEVANTVRQTLNTSACNLARQFKGEVADPVRQTLKPFSGYNRILQRTY